MLSPGAFDRKPRPYGTPAASTHRDSLTPSPLFSQRQDSTPYTSDHAAESIDPREWDTRRREMSSRASIFSDVSRTASERRESRWEQVRQRLPRKSNESRKTTWEDIQDQMYGT
jgi:hypothetical protein